jgi:hypothetical protein
MTNQSTLKYSSEISLSELLVVFWNKKVLISFITAIFAIFSIFLAISIPNKFTSTAVLMKATSTDSSALDGLSQFAGVASLAGISLPGGGNDRTIEAIEIIKSFEFFNTNFLPNIKLENLLAVKKWDYIKQELEYDGALYNQEKNIWVREVSYPKKTIPSFQEAYKTYKVIMNISQDNKTSFVNLSVQHHSPYIAKKWADIIVSEINNSMRNADKLQAMKSVNFLNSQLPNVNYEEVRTAISKLKGQQLKSLMLIESTEDYIFKSIESPIASELKSSPNRPLICFFITLFGFIFSLFFVILQLQHKKIVS